MTGKDFETNPDHLKKSGETSKNGIVKVELDEGETAIEIDSVKGAKPPETKPKPLTDEQKKKRAAYQKDYLKKKKAAEKASTTSAERKIPLKHFLIGSSRAVAMRMNDKRIECFEGEAEAMDAGWNKFFELQVPELLDKAPIMHGIMPTAEYVLRVLLTPSIPYTEKTTEPKHETRMKYRDVTKEVKINAATHKPETAITDISELRKIKLEGLDESRTAKKY